MIAGVLLLVVVIGVLVLVLVVVIGVVAVVGDASGDWEAFLQYS